MKNDFTALSLEKNKYVPFLGMEKPTHHCVHKQSHLQKEMFICSTAFLPNDNNISSGGLLFKLSCERVGHFVEAKKNTYRRVYNADGSFSYPQIDVNMLRIQGEMYFQSLGITGANKGSVSKPKYSMLDFFLEIEIPKLEELTKDIYQQHGMRTIVRYQMDNAGPHTEQ